MTTEIKLRGCGAALLIAVLAFALGVLVGSCGPKGPTNPPPCGSPADSMNHCPPPKQK